MYSWPWFGPGALWDQFEGKKSPKADIENRKQWSIFVITSIEMICVELLEDAGDVAWGSIVQLDAEM